MKNFYLKKKNILKIILSIFAFTLIIPLTKADSDFQTALPEQGDEILILDTDAGEIKIKFFPEQAPNLVENYKTLAQDEKYNDVIFHRVIDGFVIQTGDYENQNGTGGQSYTGTGLADEYSDELSHVRGAVGAARGSLPDSIGSQFYILHEDNTFLDGTYSVWGQVFEGMDVVDQIAKVETDSLDKPLEDIKIKNCWVEKYQSENQITSNASDSSTKPKLYVANTCPHCHDQLDIISGYEDEIDIIYCDISEENQTLCQEENIFAVPTWVFVDGTQTSGVQTLEQLNIVSNPATSLIQIQNLDLEDIDSKAPNYKKNNGAWGQLYIDILCALGAMDCDVSPTAKPSRGEFLEIAMKAADIEPSYGNTVFPDVSDSHKQSEYIKKAYEMGIVSGYADGNFYPNKTLTRAEALKIIFGIAQIKYAQRTGDSDFDDVNPQDWYASLAKRAHRMGIIDGNNGNFNPNAPISNQELAKILLHTLAQNKIDSNTPNNTSAQTIIMPEKSLEIILEENNITEENNISDADQKTYTEILKGIVKLAEIKTFEGDINFLSKTNMSDPEDSMSTNMLYDFDFNFKKNSKRTSGNLSGLLDMEIDSLFYNTNNHIEIDADMVTDENDNFYGRINNLVVDMEDDESDEDEEPEVAKIKKEILEIKNNMIKDLTGNWYKTTPDDSSLEEAGVDLDIVNNDISNLNIDKLLQTKQGIRLISRLTEIAQYLEIKSVKNLTSNSKEIIINANIEKIFSEMGEEIPLEDIAIDKSEIKITLANGYLTKIEVAVNVESKNEYINGEMSYTISAEIKNINKEFSINLPSSYQDASKALEIIEDGKVKTREKSNELFDIYFDTSDYENDWEDDYSYYDWESDYEMPEYEYVATDDAKRKNDLQSIKKALQKYKNKYQQYPQESMCIAGDESIMSQYHEEDEVTEVENLSEFFANEKMPKDSDLGIGYYCSGYFYMPAKLSENAKDNNAYIVYAAADQVANTQVQLYAPSSGSDVLDDILANEKVTEAQAEELEDYERGMYITSVSGK